MEQTMVTHVQPSILQPLRAPDRAEHASVAVSDLAAAVAACPTIALILTRLDELRDIVLAKTKSHYTVDEVAAMCGRTPYTVRRWVKEGRLPATRVGGTGPKGRLLVSREDVQRLITEGLGSRVQALDVEAHTPSRGGAAVHRPRGS
jgi:excisionase family DNA binding protein